MNGNMNYEAMTEEERREILEGIIKKMTPQQILSHGEVYAYFVEHEVNAILEAWEEKRLELESGTWDVLDDVEQLGLPVVLLKHEENDDVFAFFPTKNVAISNPEMKQSYSPIGQHSACSIEYADECEVLYEEEQEFKDLLDELSRVGYDNLLVLNTFGEHRGERMQFVRHEEKCIYLFEFEYDTEIYMLNKKEI